jgi:Na+-transporting NADH:ubiquinone oxidoreductase subunit D
MADSTSKLFYKGIWSENPIFRQVLGICSTLAVTNLVFNTLLMCMGLIFATTLSSFTLSILRDFTPRRIRMIVQVFVMSAWVMMVDIFIKATAPEIHRFIGPYVGLIITNCILMGRAEAFASQNKPIPSLIDGLANGIGYSLVLIAIACVREPMGFGTFMGMALPARELWWHSWVIMLMPPGAFFMLASATWIARGYLYRDKK